MISWRRDLDNSKLIGVVFLDFQRAFETVSREIMIRKMEKYGIIGHVHQWLNLYQTIRMHQVKYGSKISARKSTVHGVPQGSVLGPLFFVLYINDIIGQLKYCSCKMFADDEIIYFSDTDLCHIERKINYDLRNIVGWLKSNSL